MHRKKESFKKLATQPDQEDGFLINSYLFTEAQVGWWRSAAVLGGYPKM